MKRTATDWNPLAPEHEARWDAIDGSDGNLFQLTVTEDPETGDCTRLTKCRAGYSTEVFGPKHHAYPEEFFVLSGRLCDAAVQISLEPGQYARAMVAAGV